MSRIHNQFKKSFSFMLSLLVIWSLFTPGVGAVTTTSKQGLNDNVNQITQVAENIFIQIAGEVEYKDYSADLKSAIKGASDNIVLDGVDSEWEAIGLARAGVTIPSSYETKFLEHLQDQILNQTGKGRMKITDVERLTMAALAIGKNPMNIDGRGFNLIEKIYNSELRNTGDDSLTFQGNNGVIFALIALNSNGYTTPDSAKWNREKLVAELLKTQKADGSWSLSTSTTGSTSFDITAMALIALAPYTNEPAAKSAVDKAVTFLSNAQGLTGGFNETFVGGISSEATSQVIIGLTANKIDPRSEQFTKNGINLIDHLLSFKAEDGGFKHTSAENTSNGMATEQALQALVAFNLFIKGEGRLYEFKHESLTVNVSHPAHVKTELKDGKIHIQIKDEVTGDMKPVLIEHSQLSGGYLIIQIGDQSKIKESIDLPLGVTKVVVLHNDLPFSYFPIDPNTTAPTKEWKVTFSEALLNEPTNLEKITVQNAAGEKVAVTVTLSEDGETAKITPVTLYKKGELYYITVAEALSANGKKQKEFKRKLFIVESE